MGAWTTTVWFALTLLSGERAEARGSLLRNGGFEENTGVGSIPSGWGAVDENAEFWRWLAPRAERRIGGLPARSGRFMVGLDTEQLGVDTAGEAGHIPRAALYQTITVPGRTRGTFRVFYNDLGSGALAHVSAVHLAYTVDTIEIGDIGYPFGAKNDPPSRREERALWSQPFYRVEQDLPSNEEAAGDWTPSTLHVEIDEPADSVELTLWIGIFDHQNSTELGYWRIDDASFRLDAPSTPPSTEK